MLHGDGAERAIYLDRAAIDSILDNLYTGYRTRFKKAQHRLPVIGWTIPDAQDCTRFCRHNAGLPSQRARRAMEKILKNLIEAPKAIEAGSQRHLGHGK